MNGIGSAAWVSTYVGIPWRSGGRDIDGLDCWGMCALVLLDQMGLLLPDFLADDLREVATAQLEEPADLCLVRSETDGYADHWGVFVGGMVLHAQRPHSAAVNLRQYLEQYPDSTYWAVRHV